MSDRDLSSAEPFDDFVQDRGDTSLVQNFDDEVLSEDELLSRHLKTLNVSQFGDPEKEDGEELLDDNLERDYRPIPALDHYNDDVLDEDDCDDMNPGTLVATERELLKRDRKEGTGRRDADDILYDEHDDDETSQKKRLMADRAAAGFVVDDEQDEYMIESIENLQDTKEHSVTAWVAMLGPRTEIAKRFKNFLRNDVTSNGAYLYKDKIKRMCESNLCSLEVEFPNLANKQYTLALFLLKASSEMISIFNEVAKDVVLSMYPQYGRVTDEIFIRITDLPLVEEISSLKKIHLNQLVRTCGVVTSISRVFPQLSTIITYDCTKCGHVLGPFTQSQNQEVMSGFCLKCQSTGPLVNMEHILYKNYQKITIQESLGTTKPPGRKPYSIECALLADLCDQCKLGDEIDVTGIYFNSYEASLIIGNEFTVFATVIIANYLIIKDNKHIVESLSDEDVSQILKLSKDRKIAERIAASIAPSIFGHSYIKRNIALALFGGEPKKQGDIYTLRGDINILLCGGPGTVKNQFLNYVEKVAPRAIFIACQNASAISLVAYFKRDKVHKEWTLAAGDLVLADQGVCIIDELDKLNDQDRTTICEAIEEQSIFVSNAGFVTSLQTRCSVMAATSPKGGHYNPEMTFPENVNLSEFIMSRFDILCILQEELDQVGDISLATYLAQRHMCKQSELRNALSTFGVEPIPQDLLKKYIIYSKQHIHPKLNRLDQRKVSKMYSQLRQDSVMTGSLPIRVRHIESIIRMAEAYAKMHLRNYVEEDDVNMAICIMLESFIKTQKCSVMKIMRKTFQKYLSFNKYITEHLYSILHQMATDQLAYMRGIRGITVNTIVVHEKDFKDKVKQIGTQFLQVHDFRPFYENELFKNNNFVYDEKRHLIIQTLHVSE